jgi:hypothetical protein
MYPQGVDNVYNSDLDRRPDVWRRVQAKTRSSNQPINFEHSDTDFPFTASPRMKSRPNT